MVVTFFILLFMVGIYNRKTSSMLGKHEGVVYGILYRLYRN